MIVIILRVCNGERASAREREGEREREERKKERERERETYRLQGDGQIKVQGRVVFRR